MLYPIQSFKGHAFGTVCTQVTVHVRALQHFDIGICLCRHPSWQRRLQGANPCAEHGRDNVKSNDPTSCLLSDTADLLTRAQAITSTAPYYNPDWEEEHFWHEPFPGTNQPYSSIWKIRPEDMATYNSLNDSVYKSLAYNQTRQSVLDYIAPNLLTASWQSTASFSPTHHDASKGASEEWNTMSRVRPLCTEWTLLWNTWVRSEAPCAEMPGQCCFDTAPLHCSMQSHVKMDVHTAHTLRCVCFGHSRAHAGQAVLARPGSFLVGTPGSFTCCFGLLLLPMMLGFNRG
jgi:hypothetical protein